MGERRGPASLIVTNSGTGASETRFLPPVYGRGSDTLAVARVATEVGSARSPSCLASLRPSRRQDSFRLKGYRSRSLSFFRRESECVVSVFVDGDGFIAFLFITVLKCEPWGRRRWQRRFEHHLRSQRHSRRRRRRWMARPLLARWSSRPRRLCRCRRMGRPRAAGS